MARTRRTDEDEVLLEALSAGMKHAEAALIASVSTKTIQRRLSEPSFIAELSQRRAVRIHELIGRFSVATDRAVDTIEACLESEKPAIRLRAAEVILNWNSRFHEHATFEVRVAALEVASASPTGDTTGEEQR